MNICSPCSGDFAFTKHPHLGDVTKWHLSLTHSSWHLIHMHNWNSILWFILPQKQPWTRCEVLLIWQCAHSIKKGRKLISSTKLKQQKMFTECKIPRAWTANIHSQMTSLNNFPPRSYSTLGNTGILNQLPAVFLHISTVHCCD